MNRFILAIAAASHLVLTLPADGAVTAVTRPVVASPGATGDCSDPALSADGRFVVFASDASNLVPGDNNQAKDIFVRDRATGRTQLVSVATNALSGRGPSLAPAISSDGAWIAFESWADDLVPGDTNGVPDVFLRDRVNGLTTCVSRGTNGANGNLGSFMPRLTADGNLVFFESLASNLDVRDTNMVADLFVFQRAAGKVHLLTREWRHLASAGLSSYFWAGPWESSADGSRVVFQSSASNLLPNDTKGKQDIVARDWLVPTNRLVSATSEGAFPGYPSANPSISRDGRWVAFDSMAPLAAADQGTSTQQSDVYLRDLANATLLLISANTNGLVPLTAKPSLRPRLSGDASTVLFFSAANDLVPGDTNASTADLFVHEVSSGMTSLLGPTAGYFGGPMPAVSVDGRIIVWVDRDGQLTRLDRSTGTAKVIASGVPMLEPGLSADGRLVVFTAPGSVAGLAGAPPWLNVFLFDSATGLLELVSVPERLGEADTGGDGLWPSAASISGDGRWLAFSSAASHLTLGDTNGASDVIVHDLGAGTNLNVSLEAGPFATRAGPSLRSVLSRDGAWIAYETLLDLPAEPPTLDSMFSLVACDIRHRTNMVVAGLGNPSARARQAFSAEGRVLAFLSGDAKASPLANGRVQVYWRDLTAPTNRLVSRQSSGLLASAAHAFNPALSLDGRRVAFLSAAKDLVTNSVIRTNAFLWDSTSDEMRLLTMTDSQTGSGGASDVDFLGDGHLLAVQVMTNLWLFDLDAGGPPRVVDDADQASASDDGRWLAVRRRAPYASEDLNDLPDIYVVDLRSGAAELASIDQPSATGPTGESFAPRISCDGRYVAFVSRSARVAPGDANSVTDLFVRDRTWGVTFALSLPVNGLALGRGPSLAPTFSADGRTIAFASYADDLAGADGNGAPDLFVFRLAGGDSDADGLPDDWELAFFGTLDRDGIGDADGDGLSDAGEYRAGTHPIDDESVLAVLTVTRVVEGATVVLWKAAPGRSYQVEYKDNVDDPAWTPLPGEAISQGATALMNDPAARTAPRRYYRVRLR